MLIMKQYQIEKEASGTCREVSSGEPLFQFF